MVIFTTITSFHCKLVAMIFHFKLRLLVLRLINVGSLVSYLNLVIIKCLSGSLIKLIYFSRHVDRSVKDRRKKFLEEKIGVSNGIRRSYPLLGGRLHFVKFETTKINECLDFISSKQLHYGGICLLYICLSLCGFIALN